MHYHTVTSWQSWTEVSASLDLNFLWEADIIVEHTSQYSSEVIEQPYQVLNVLTYITYSCHVVNVT